jgi:hypothetical protein
LVVLVPHTAVVATWPTPTAAELGIEKAVPSRMGLGAVKLNVGFVEATTVLDLSTTSMVKVQEPV